MNEDLVMLYGSSVLCLIVVLILFKFSRRFAIINLLIFIVYSVRFYYGFYYEGEGGTTIVWWAFTIIANICLILVDCFFIAIIKASKAKLERNKSRLQ